MSVLSDELINDPLGRNYAAMTDQQAADSLNTVDRERERTSMSRTEVMQSIDQGEFDLLADGPKADVWGVLGVDNVDPRTGSFEEHVFIAIFGGGSATLIALNSARTENLSRAQELGLSKVRAGTVNAARA